MKKRYLLLITLTAFLLINCKNEKNNLIKDNKLVEPQEKVLEVSGKNKSDDKLKLINSQTKKNKTVLINFDKKINGYEVEVTWKPKYERSNNLVGSAILNFTKSDKSFIIQNNHFALNTSNFSYETDDNDQIVNVLPIKAEIKYRDIKLIDNRIPEEIETPFFFLDINFDGNDELLLLKYGQGQRFFPLFEPFFIEGNKLADNNSKMKKLEPFVSIDSFTEIDSLNEEIVIFGSGGVCFNTYKTFSNVDGKITLSKIIQEERDDENGKCFKKIYEIKNGIKKLVSKKEIK